MPDESLIPMSDDEIATTIAVLLASRTVPVPVISRRSPVDPVERDRLRDGFARELVAALKKRNVRFVRVPTEAPGPRSMREP